MSSDSGNNGNPSPTRPHAVSETTAELGEESAHWDLRREETYGGYLHLEKILSAQHPRSSEHDEMLFVIIHQASELWMKLVIHELRACIFSMQRDNLDPCFKTLARVSRIQAQLTQSWDVLSTMTPFEYSGFRNSLGPASGFQSWQYRSIEFMLGNKNPDLIRVYQSDPERYAELAQLLAAPSLYDEALQLLSRRGFEIPNECLSRDFSQPYVANAQVTAAWLAIYHSTKSHWDLYELAEKLIDLDHHFQLWRFAHMKTVERIIGFKRGTGGTSGVSYLAKALELRFFPELWSVRTSI